MEKNYLSEIWEIIRDIILPHIGRLVGNTVFFTILGLVLIIVFLVILTKRKFLDRKNRGYHLAVRIIYFPSLILLTLNFWGQIGIGRGVYKILTKENEPIVNSIYDVTVSQFLDSEESKVAFLEQIRNSAKSNGSIAENFNKYLKQTHSDVDIVENTKNKFTEYLTQKYEKQVYGAILYGLFYAADKKFVKEIKLADIEQLTDKLMTVDYTKIESSIKFGMSEKLQDLYFIIYAGFVKSNLMIWLICLLVPFLEFFIYKIFTRNQGIKN